MERSDALTRKHTLNHAVRKDDLEQCHDVALCIDGGCKNAVERRRCVVPGIDGAVGTGLRGFGSRRGSRLIEIHACVTLWGALPGNALPDCEGCHGSMIRPGGLAMMGFLVAGVAAVRPGWSTLSLSKWRHSKPAPAFSRTIAAPRPTLHLNRQRGLTAENQTRGLEQRRSSSGLIIEIKQFMLI